MVVVVVAIVTFAIMVVEMSSLWPRFQAENDPNDVMVVVVVVVVVG